MILWSCIIKIHIQWPSWRLGNWFAFNFYLIWELFMLRRTQFSNFSQHTAKLHSSCFLPTPFSVRSACFSFQGYVFEHISPNVKLISDNKFQSSGISFYKVQPVRRENDVFVQHSQWLPRVSIFCFWSYPFWREVGKRQGMVGNLQASHLIIRICTKGITSDLVFHMNLFGAERFKRKPKLQNRQNLGNPR